MSRLLRGVIAALTITFLAVLGLQVPAMAAPANDNFASATALTLPGTTTGSSVAITGDNTTATIEAGENACCWVNHTVWYKFTAQKTANYQIELCNSNFDTLADVYTGSSVNALTEVKYSSRDYYNNDAPGCGADGKKSKLSWIGFTGTTYDIAIGNYAGAGDDTSIPGGTISGSLSLISPSNDFFADAIALPAGGGPIVGSNAGASTEPGENTCCWHDQSVWYTFTPATTTSYTMELCGSSFDTVVQVFTGATVDALTEISYLSPSYYWDDAPGCGADGKKSRFSFQAAAGTLYRIRIGANEGAGNGYHTQGGSIVGSIMPAALPAGTVQGAAAKPTTRAGKTALKVSGTIGLPSGVSASQGCSGTVRVTVTSGPRTLGTKTAAVSSSCAFAARPTFRRKLAKGNKVIVTLAFSGNAAVGASTTHKRVRI